MGIYKYGTTSASKKAEARIIMIAELHRAGLTYEELCPMKTAELEKLWTTWKEETGGAER